MTRMVGGDFTASDAKNTIYSAQLSLGTAVNRKLNENCENTDEKMKMK